MTGRNLAYVGNFGAEHSTENHVKRAMTNNGHTVTPFQENEVACWEDLVDRVTEFDFVLWTRTGWDPPVPVHLQHAILQRSEAAGKAVVGFHLDRWFGLNRENQIKTEPFFRSTIVFTADGGRQKEFAERGVNHVWLPPGVSRDECLREPRRRREFLHDVVFCGSSDWYHSEWSYRIDLVRWLEKTFRGRLGVYPRDKPALRGQDLVDLYGNAKVMVGDSCLAGGAKYYWSDRIPETLGRGGFLIHPYVVGIEDHFTDEEHLALYQLGDFDMLKELIEKYVADDAERERIAKAGKEHVLANHTYEVRTEQMLDILAERGLV